MIGIDKKKFLLTVKLINEILYHLKFIPEKIRNRFGLKQRNKNLIEIITSYKVCGSYERSELWSEFATLPGCLEFLPANCPESWRSKDKVGLQDLFERRFPILSEKSFSITLIDDNRKLQLHNLAKSVPEEYTNNYKLINWHKDFSSGYEWDANQIYLEIRVAPKAGVEIKIPRELSRFQHIGILASAPSPEAGHEFILEVLDWIIANPFGYGVNWACTMDVALRVINWIWGMRFFEATIKLYPEIASKIITSIHQHGRFIENNLEYYKSSTGNHYLSNIVGLIYVSSAFPEFPESDRWLLFGLQELNSEMKREVYKDGASHEGSTNYHKLVAELFVSGTALLDRLPIQRRKQLLEVNVKEHKVRPRLKASSKALFNLTSQTAIMPRSFYESLSRMADFTESLIKPNGLVPQFGDNDSARVHKLYPDVNHVNNHDHVVALIRCLLGQKLSLTGLAEQFEANLIAGGIDLRLDIKAATLKHVVHHKHAGIAILRNQDIFLAVSCGQNGQNGRGGHNHNDKLSFELSVRGFDFVVDGGCPVYTANPKIRNRFRGTRAHSTVIVNNQEQDRWTESMHGLFVLRERSFPKLYVEENLIRGEHFGYSSKHEREFHLSDSYLCINDNVKIIGDRIMNFNLHPDVDCQVVECNTAEVNVILRHDSGLSVYMNIYGVNNPQINSGCYSLGYGIPVYTQSLQVTMVGYSTSTKISWC